MTMRLLTMLILLGMPVATIAQQLSVSPSINAADIGRWTIALVVVLILIFVSAWGLRRFQSSGNISGQKINIIAGASLGGRERAVLVKVANRHLLLGVASGSVQTLHVFANNELVENTAATSKNIFSESSLSSNGAEYAKK